MDFSDVKSVIEGLRGAQGTQRDLRLAVKEAHNFVDKRDGQWEPDIIRRMRGKPRYTDDRTNPIVNQIAGELENAEFSLKVRPAGGTATNELAQIRDGMLRNIRNVSDADHIFAQAARKMVKGGFAAWLINHDYVDSDSFDQDLVIEPIHDAHERVWLDPDDLTDDGSNSKWGVVFHFVGRDTYAENFPKGKMQSLGMGSSWSSTYYYKPEFITIGHLYYLEDVPDQLYRMTDGQVLKASEVSDEALEALAAQGIEVDDVRDVDTKVCKFRMFDAGGWLTSPDELNFDSIPIVPVYGNFEISEGKILYRGAVEKLMDMQRVHNYAVSRNVEEIALAPRKKIFMTPAQAEGHEDSIQSMNTNMDPVQMYNPDGVSPPPFEAGAPNVNAAVQTLVEQSDQSISRAAGLFAANMGDNPNVQSGVALDRIIDRGNNGTSIYFEAMERAITRTGRILLKALPKVYDATRQIRILKEDDKIEQVVINTMIPTPFGPETINDLNVGKYDVVCDVGPAYKNRQQEGIEMFARVLEKDPSLIQVAGDTWIKNINAPGFDVIAERLRALALQNGMIPQSQMTEEELAQMEQAQQQPEQPSAEEIQLQIAQTQAETALLAEQNKGTEHQIKMQGLQVKFAGDQEKLQSKLAVDGAKIQQTQERIDLEKQNQQFEQMFKMMQAQTDQVTQLASALNNIKSAIGADAIINSNAAQAYDGIAKTIEGETKDL